MTLAFLTGADGRLVRNPRVLGIAFGLQSAIVLFDAATVWTPEAESRKVREEIFQ